MNEKQKEIIAFLKKSNQQWTTSNDLASFCMCTTRTIRNHIAKINQEAPNTILTSNRGYQLNSSLSASLNSQSDQGDRKSLIFLELLKNSVDGIDIYDLSERLFISESTLKSDIQQLKKEIIDNNIQIIFENNFIKLTGAERSKRRYLISLLYNESDIQEKLKNSIQQMIGYISLEKLQETIKKVLLVHHVEMNQYSLNNIVLHYAISIERIRQGHAIKKKQDYQSLKEKSEYFIAEEIANNLAKEYQIKFSEAELEQLSLLFIGIQNEALTNKQDQKLEEFVDQKIILTLKKILQQVEKTYLIELDDEEFFTKLAIHLQSLYYRSHYECFTRNSSLLDLKTSYPLTYDLSVYISSLLQEELGIWFNDDEISFIALHIGAFLETKKNNQDKTIMLLMVNEYHNIGEQVQEKLKHRFGETVSIIISNDIYVEKMKYDLLVTTDRNVASEHSGSVFIHPFVTTKDLRKVENRLHALKLQKQKKQMYQYIDRFISRKLYFNQIDPSDLSAKDIRKQMNQKLLEFGFVDNKFIFSVEKRENMSPTSFPSGIAVPHALELEALKSSVSVMTLQESILWSGYPVRLIALVAINKDEAKEFNDFFEKFIEIVSDPVNTKMLGMADDYDEFVLKLKMMVDADE